MSTYAGHAFGHTGPSTWNALPNISESSTRSLSAYLLTYYIYRQGICYLFLVLLPRILNASEQFRLHQNCYLLVFLTFYILSCALCTGIILLRRLTVLINHCVGHGAHHYVKAVQYTAGDVCEKSTLQKCSNRKIVYIAPATDRNDPK